jgi:hypothetical protein
MSVLTAVVTGDAADAFREYYKINSRDEAYQKRAQKEELWYEPNPWNDPTLRHPNRDAFEWAADEVVRRFLSGRYTPQKSPQKAQHFSQGNKVATRQNGSFKAVSSTPDVCKTPCGGATPPVPYPVIADLAGSTGVVSNVRFNGKPAYTLNQSVVPTCTGDEAGCAMGVKSGTVGGEVKPTAGSSTVRVGGNSVIRDGDPCTMNNGNCTGTYVTVPTAGSSIGPDGKVVGDASPPPDKGVMHQVGGFFAGGGGAVWDMAKGVGHLAVGVAELSPVSQAAEGVSKLTGWYDYQGYTDTQNTVKTTSQAIYNNPKAIVDGITKPYVEAWSQGNYGEALGRGAVDIGGLFVGGIGAVGKAGEAGEALNAVSKAGEAAEAVNAAGKAGEGAEAANVGAKAGEAGESAAPTGKVAETGPAKDGLNVSGDKSTGLPAWLKERFEAGNEFNRANRSRYLYNEVEVVDSSGNKFRVDSYDPINGEIVSRKFTQLSEVKPETGISYLQELGRKYPSGATISDSAFNPSILRGQRLSGDLILEVPAQNNPIPQAVLDYANKNGMIIRDVTGVTY